MGPSAGGDEEGEFEALSHFTAVVQQRNRGAELRTELLREVLYFVHFVFCRDFAVTRLNCVQIYENIYTHALAAACAARGAAPPSLCFSAAVPFLAPSPAAADREAGDGRKPGGRRVFRAATRHA